MTRTAIKNQAAEAMEAVKPPTLRWVIRVKKRKGKGGSKRVSVRTGVDSRHSSRDDSILSAKLIRITPENSSF